MITLKKMAWWKLKDGLCPRCGAKLEDDKPNDRLNCVHEVLCKFSIRKQRAVDIVAGLNEPRGYQH